MSGLTNFATWAPLRTAFLSAITPEECQTTAYACALELRTTSVRRRTCVGYDAPTAGSSLTVVSYEPAIDCCALCGNAWVAAVSCMHKWLIVLECKVLMSTINFPQKLTTCSQQ